MIAADQADELAVRRASARVVVATICVQRRRELVHACEARLEIGMPLDHAARLDHRLGRGARLGVERRDLRIDRQHRDPRLVGAAGLDVEEIDLPARREDRRRPASGALPYEVVGSQGTGISTTLASSAEWGRPKMPSLRAGAPGSNAPPPVGVVMRPV